MWFKNDNSLEPVGARVPLNTGIDHGVQPSEAKVAFVVVARDEVTVVDGDEMPVNPCAENVVFANDLPPMPTFAPARLLMSSLVQVMSEGIVKKDSSNDCKNHSIIHKVPHPPC
jgi:hypothetical protein